MSDLRDELTDTDAFAEETDADTAQSAAEKLAAFADDCSDSREYRLGGYDELSADPEVGA